MIGWPFACCNVVVISYVRLFMAVLWSVGWLVADVSRFWEFHEQKAANHRRDLDICIDWDELEYVLCCIHHSWSQNGVIGHIESESEVSANRVLLLACCFQCYSGMEMNDGDGWHAAAHLSLPAGCQTDCWDRWSRSWKETFIPTSPEVHRPLTHHPISLSLSLSLSLSQNI